MNPSWHKVSLFFLLIVALIGTLLRALPYVTLPFEYEHFLHAHSHVAFQGWIYSSLFLLVTHLFLTKEQIKKGRYKLQLRLTFIVILGVLVSFIIQGYGLYSIIFSTLFQLLNYWFIYVFFKQTKQSKPQPISLRFIKTAFVLGILSTLAPWGIGILSAKGLAGTEAYNSIIYFFLHFQYNGWFLFAIIGVIFKCIEDESIEINPKIATQFLYTLLVATILGYSLSLLGMSFRNVIYFPAVLSVVLQLLALFLLLRIILRLKTKWISTNNFFLKLLIATTFTAFVLKIILQSASIFPIFSDYAFGNRFVIISYLHLCLLGVLSFAIIAILIHLKWCTLNIISKFASLIFWLGFIVTEILLITVGLGILYLPNVLMIASGSMAFGVFLLLINKKTMS